MQIEVLVPPAVQAMPRVGKVTVRKGKDFTLRCAAKGNPNPTISWSKEVTLKLASFQEIIFLNEISNLVAGAASSEEKQLLC